MNNPSKLGTKTKRVKFQLKQLKSKISSLIKKQVHAKLAAAKERKTRDDSDICEVVSILTSFLLTPAASPPNGATGQAGSGSPENCKDLAMPVAVKINRVVKGKKNGIP